MAGSWSAAELPHRVSQMYVEAILREEAGALPDVSIRTGLRMVAVRDNGAGVEVETEPVAGGERRTLRAAYAVGADGGTSPTRKALGIRYGGESRAERDFMGGRMFAFHFRSNSLYDLIPHPRAWMYWTINPHRRCFMASVNGRDEFTFHTQLKADQTADAITDAAAKAMLADAMAAPIDVELIARSSWNAGYTLVAERYGAGRILLGGDAVHLFTPTGGLGYNTAVEDAVNLGWKLAAMLKGWGGPELIASYETERQAIARRNTAYARGFADSVGLYVPPPELEDDSRAGEEARRIAGDHFNAHARAEFNIPGVTFGGRYDGSPIVISDGTSPPPDAANTYVASACPGGRAPHAWLPDGRSLYDAFGFDFTLLRLGPRAPEGAAFGAAAAALGLPLEVLSLPDAALRELYGADLALVRPDQIVAWRGNDAGDAAMVLRRASGWA